MNQKTIVITGSTKGIGKGIALYLARQHHRVVLNYAMDDVQAQETLRQFQQEQLQVLLVKADIAHRAEVGHLLQATLHHFGRVDVLVNNAARVRDKPLLEMTEDEWDTVVNTNMKGTFLCSQLIASHMLQQEQGGCIINIGASTGIRARKNGVNTCASKAGIHLITQSLALELGPKIRALTVVPGLTRTEEVAHRFRLDDPDVLRSRIETIPLQRIGTPDDIAKVVAWLISDDAQWINGQKIFADGGQYMW
ncbi:SDR family NAD(P)-dependent oxidoreductase [Ktedonospora formicarum]|uniref:Beta-ketoacyl-ACP reductase n=1 Tax=Ktedonospora formicarum TaxID=2778364 RepID=A0A8J3IBZ0_9CHLR|nr:glucose 1-dehydrogenase [Ktedonospora formicarum]GHO48579.1 beta-ketoacyl-ACP reductase [Ktedonospora formicarum]